MITEQYLDYIKAMETEDMNVMSEFLVMAATLLDIKCRMLLPKEVNEEGEEEDPRAELVQKLLEYKMYKYMAYELKDRQVDAAKTWFKDKTLPKEIEDYRPPIDMQELLGDADLGKLQELFHMVMRLTHKSFSFMDLMEKQRSKMEIIVTFMVILELMKTGKITIVQEDIFDDIWITSKAG